MRVACVGGGPAGLFLALLLRRSSEHQVDVYERSPAGSAYGFGVVFSRLTLARLRKAAPDVVAALLERGARWDDVEVRRGGAVACSSGHGFAAVSRQQLIATLAEAAADAGARLHFSAPADAADLLERYDLVVAADGAGSGTRQSLAGPLGEHVEPGGSRYAWFGVDRRFDAMTFLFAEGEHGPVSAHVYPYDERRSTFLVEVDEHTWQAGEFTDGSGTPPGWNDPDALAYCAEVFAADLGGARLLAHGSRWLPFRELRTERWSTGRLVLIGDAAHTVHFSVGSGTALAMEDAAELVRCLTAEPGADPEAALTAYEAARRQPVDCVQQAGRVSRRMWAQPREHRDLDVGMLLLRLLTRTGQTTMDVLLRVDPGLADRVGRPLTRLPEIPVPTVAPAGAPVDPPAVVLAGIAELAAAVAGSEPPPGGTPVPVVVELPAGPLGQVAAALREARAAAPHRPLGILLRAGCDGPPGPAGAVTELVRATDPDLVAVGTGPGLPGPARIAQMVLCEQVRAAGVETAYLCAPGELAHGWTHVQAGRADQVWTTA